MPIVKLDYLNTKINNSYVAQSTPDSNLHTNGQVFIQSSVTSETQAFIKFDLGLIPNNAVINSATLKMTQSITTNRIVKLKEVTQDWDQSTITWNNKPTFKAEVLAESTNKGSGLDHNIDIKTVVQGWVNGNQNYGLAMTSDDINQSAFYSNYHATLTVRPTLTIDYEIPMEKKKQVEHIAKNSFALPSSGTLNADVALPAGVKEGDLLMALLTTISAISLSANGWTLISHESYSSENRFSVLTKIADGTETNIEINFSANAGSGSITNHIFRNVKNVIGAAEPIKSGTGTAIAPNPATGVPPKSLLLLLGVQGNVATIHPTIGMNDLSVSSLNTRTMFTKGLYTYDKDSFTSTELSVTSSMTNVWGVKTILLVPFTNEVPTIDGTDEHLGTYDMPLSKQYIVSDTEGDAITVVERLDGAIINTLNGVGTYTLDLSTEWPVLAHGKHTVTITATDPEGRSEVRTWTFTKVLNLQDDTETLIKGLMDTLPPLDSIKQQLVDKVGGDVADTFEGIIENIIISRGAKWAEGVSHSPAGKIEVRGLDFKPSVVVYISVPNPASYNGYAADIDGDIRGIQKYGSSARFTAPTFYDDGFVVDVYEQGASQRWKAYE